MVSLRGLLLWIAILLAPLPAFAAPMSDFAILPFRDASLELSERHEDILRDAIRRLKECGPEGVRDARVRITSSAQHARSSGALQTLGMRAYAASAFLVDNGVREERIETEVKARVKHRTDPKRYPKQLLQYVQVEWACGE